VFTNTALTDDGDIWWEGMTDEPPAHLTDWKGNDWTPASDTPAAHPNARFTAPAAQDPAIAPEWEDPAGVPISAILFGGRRGSVVPLVFQSHDWEHGVFLGSIMASETTAAQAGAVGNLRRDPFAMLPFCGYNMADYFAHWLQIGAEAPDRNVLPKIFYVNWFRKDDKGKFLWPGYGENSRVLEWIFQRVTDKAPAVDTAIGSVPTVDAIDTDGLAVSVDDMEELLRVDLDGWRAEVPLIREYYAKFGDRLPGALFDQVDTLEKRLG
jgi:phosphoenolpyruvate carboxykinase (GTP)